MLSVGSIVSGAFRLVKERPVSVGIWGLFYAAASAATTFAMLPLIGMQNAALTSGSVDPAQIWPMFGRLILFQLALFLLVMVLFTASQRAVLRPADQGFAYLRLGMDELRMIGLAIILAILFYVGMVAIILVMSIFAAIVATAGGGGSAVVLIVLVTLAVIGLAVWLEVRLSLTFPLTFLRRKIIIGESWRLSRGRFWTLFGGYLAIVLILIALWIVVAMATSGPYLAEIMKGGFTTEAMQAAGQRQLQVQLSGISVMTVVGWVLGGLLGALGIALGGAAVATAARDLATDQEALTQEFA